MLKLNKVLFLVDSLQDIKKVELSKLSKIQILMLLYSDAKLKISGSKFEMRKKIPQCSIPSNMATYHYKKELFKSR